MIFVFAVFLFNFLVMSTKHLPTFKSNALLQETACPDYGCPIYPAELTPEVNEYLKSYFVTNARQNWNFSFGTESMAILTQQGASHTENQDRAVVFTPFKTQFTASTNSMTHDNNSFLIGLFDGHGRQGHIVASYILHDLPGRLAGKLNAMKHFDDNVIIKALNDTFMEVNAHGPPNLLMGGSTGSVTLRIGSKLYIANTGDSQTVLFSISESNDPIIEFATRKDKPILPEEYKRITNLKGNVHINPHTNDSRVVVWSVAQRDTIALAMSRSIGDWEWKPVGVTAEPLVDVIDLKKYPKSYLMVASDGLWDVRRKEFYGKQFMESFYGGQTHPLVKAVEVFEKVTPKRNIGYRDDMTAILMKL